ncbi:hypothetical protein HK101_003116 [Irineochytrium annulatum]|nr:hypothetical protein HK101_003116 [Irineochytrium annulatum]
MDVYAPTLDVVVSFGTGFLQKFTDPILDPMVDAVLVVAGLLGMRMANGTASSGVEVEGVVNQTEGDVAVATPEPEIFANVIPEVEEIGVANRTQPVSTQLVDVVPIHVSGNLSVLEGQVDINETALHETAPAANVSEDAVKLAAAREAQRARIKEAARRLREPDTARLWGLPEQLAHTLIGYATHSLLLYHHARRTGRLNHPYAQTMRRILVKWLLYLATAVKFTFFITIELGMFPTFCGMLIDFCTLPVFGPTATVASRWAFYRAFPWSSWFLHWLAGTTFMFQFAIYISTVRKIVRRGVVWFIRDPDDPAFHPMQDIIEKPALHQLRKLAVGTTTYAFVVLSSVGGFVGLVRLLEIVAGATTGPARIWPIKWEFSEPLSEFPIDLLIFHFLLPWTIAWVRPRQVFRTILDKWFRFAARWLRLTHFLFGVRVRDEESDTEEDDDQVPVRLIHEDDPPAPHPIPADEPVMAATLVEEEDGWEDEEWEDDMAGVVGPQGDQSALADLAAAAIAAGPITTEGPSSSSGTSASDAIPTIARKGRQYPYLRVPNHDHVEIIPGQKMMIPMERGAPLMGRVNETVDEVRANWTRVYVPDRFRMRVVLLLVFQWICGLFLFAGLVVGPLYIGRVAFVQFHEFMVAEPEILVNGTMPATTVFVNGSADTVVHEVSDDPAMPMALNETGGAFNVSSFTNSTSYHNVTAHYLILGLLGSSVRPEVPVRPDLPVHDLFSYSLGLFIIIAAWAGVLWIEKTIKWAYESMGRFLVTVALETADASATIPVPASASGGAGVGRRRSFAERHEAHRKRLVEAGALHGAGLRRRRSSKAAADVGAIAEGLEADAADAGVGSSSVGPVRTEAEAVPEPGSASAAKDTEVFGEEVLAEEEVDLMLPEDGQEEVAPVVVPLRRLRIAAVWEMLAVAGAWWINTGRRYLISLYVVFPAMASYEQTRVIFILQDWALGAMYTKIMYTLVLAGPETNFRRALALARDQLREGGLQRLQLRPLATKIIFPLVAVTTLSIVPPLGVMVFMEAASSSSDSANGFQSALLRYVIPGLFSAFIGYELLSALRRMLRRWMAQIRDDHFLVGRRLHNLGEETNSSRARRSRRTASGGSSVDPSTPLPPRAAEDGFNVAGVAGPTDHVSKTLGEGIARAAGADDAYPGRTGVDAKSGVGGPSGLRRMSDDPGVGSLSGPHRMSQGTDMNAGVGSSSGSLRMSERTEF